MRVQSINSFNHNPQFGLKISEGARDTFKLLCKAEGSSVTDEQIDSAFKTIEKSAPDSVTLKALNISNRLTRVGLFDFRDDMNGICTLDIDGEEEISNHFDTRGYYYSSKAFDENYPAEKVKFLTDYICSMVRKSAVNNECRVHLLSENGPGTAWLRSKNDNIIRCYEINSEGDIVRAGSGD